MTIFHSILLFGYPLPISLFCVISWFSYLPVFPSSLIYLSIYLLLSVYLSICNSPTYHLFTYLSGYLYSQYIYIHLFICLHWIEMCVHMPVVLMMSNSVQFEHDNSTSGI